MKYDVLFCRCGRVHFTEKKKLLEICDKQGKEILHICNHCGFSVRRGVTDYDDGMAWYAEELNNKEITDTSNIGLIIATRGEQIRMQTGGEATSKVGGMFYDWGTPRPRDISEQEWLDMLRTVDTQATINWIRDDEKLKALSHYAVKIDWTGTKYAR